MADHPPKIAQPIIPKAAPGPGSYNSVAAQYARAKAERERVDEKSVAGILGRLGLGGGEGRGRGEGKEKEKEKGAFESLNDEKERRFKGEWGWVVGFWVWLL